MKVIETKLPGVRILEPQVFGDARGWFMESWSQKKMEDAGIHVDFVQDNHSFSAERGTLRGLHYQLNPMAQAKLLRVSRGAVFDVAVDIRRGSPTYAQWIGIELSAENYRQLPMGLLRSPIMLRCSIRRIISMRRIVTVISAGMTLPSVSRGRSPLSSFRRRMPLRRVLRSGQN